MGLDKGLSLQRDGTFLLKFPSYNTDQARIWTSFDSQEKKHWLTVHRGDLVGRFILQDNLKAAWNDGRSTPEKVHNAVDAMIDRIDNVSSNVQAVCDWFGPTDFLQMGGSHNKPDSPESRLVGGAIQENSEKVAEANPITYVDKNDPPILIMHGDQDPLVPYSQSVLFEEKLQAAGVQVQLVKMEGEGHGGRGFDSPKAREQVSQFFNKVLHPEMKKAPELDPK